MKRSQEKESRKGVKKKSIKTGHASNAVMELIQSSSRANRAIDIKSH